jgi:predicted MFS family arabinose efflux permease
VFVEGCCILGLFPYISSFLFDRGVTSLSIAGLVIACFAVGGLFYTATVSRMLARLGINGMMIYGGIVIAIQLAATAFSPNWQIQALSLLLMGWGFYMLHGSLQIFSTELSQEARASAMSLHAFCFFMGQSVGPIAYGFGLAHAGKMPTLLISAAIVFALGFAAAKLLRPMKPTDAKA